MKKLKSVKRSYTTKQSKKDLLLTAWDFFKETKKENGLKYTLKPIFKKMMPWSWDYVLKSVKNKFFYR